MRSFLRSLYLAPTLLFLVGQHAKAQEPVSIERAREFARHLVEYASKLENVAIRVDADVLNPFGLRAGEAGALVVPDRNLKETTLENSTQTPVPVGELFLRNVTLTVDGKPVEKSKLQFLSVPMQEQKVEVPIYLLAAGKDANGNLELLVFGKGNEPIARARLGKVPSKSKMPIELTAEKQGDDSGLLTLSIAGQFEAELLLQHTNDSQ